MYRKFGGHLPEVSSNRKWRTLLLLALVELLAMAAWFSATAIVPALSDAWGLDAGGGAWLTMSVQIGFVVGTLLSAVFSLADRIPVRWFFASSALLAGLTTALIPAIATWLGAALALRFLIGIFLAGVYPVGMKIMATWTKADGGLAIGLLVGALAEGPPESERCHLSASTVHRWLDQAGIKAQESVEGQLEGIADTKSAGGRPEVVYGLWAKLRGGGKRVVLMLTDSVTGRPENR